MSESPAALRAQGWEKLAEASQREQEGRILLARAEKLAAQQASATGPLSSEEAAQYLGVKPRTLEGWRLKKKGPAFLKVGALVGYRLSDLDFYLEAQRRTSTAEHRDLEGAAS